MEEIELIESLLLDEEFVYEASEFFNANYPLNDDEKYFQLVKEFYEFDSEEFDKLYFSRINSHFFAISAGIIFPSVSPSRIRFFFPKWKKKNSPLPLA